MKKIFYFLIAIIILFGCNNRQKKPTPITQIDSFFIADSVHELPTMVAKRKKPPIKTTPIPPNTEPSGNNTPSGTVYNVIFYDFDGGIISGTSWNYNGDIIYTPSGLQQSQIDSIMMRIKYALDSLNVVVTTDETLYNKTPSNNRIKVIFTAYNEWYGTGAGGTSFIGSFGTEQPAWVFTKLYTYRTYRIGEAACHETGHTLGLYHQSVYDTACNYLSEYKPGTIMGSTLNTPGWWGMGVCDPKQQDLKQMAALVGWKY